jgi:hypothetical protein
MLEQCLAIADISSSHSSLKQLSAPSSDLFCSPTYSNNDMHYFLNLHDRKYYTEFDVLARIVQSSFVTVMKVDKSNDHDQSRT